MMVMPDTCSFPGCGLPIRAYGLCASHARQRDRGRPLAPLRPVESDRVRLAGPRVAPFAAERLTSEAARRRVPVGEVLRDVIEGWAKRRRPAAALQGTAPTDTP